MARKNFMREKRIYCGEQYLEVDIVHVSNIPEGGRRASEVRSSQKQQNLNDKNSKRRFVQLANTNFGRGDYHITLTYDDKHLPKTLEDAEKEVHNYLNRVKRKMKKDTGEDIKYMLVTEYTPEKPEPKKYQEEMDGQLCLDLNVGRMIVEEDERTKVVRIHHHIIVNGALPRDTMELLWSKARKINWKKAAVDIEYRSSIQRIGYANCDNLQPDENGLEALANYINKRKKGHRKWSGSQNLKKPKVKKNDHKYSMRRINMYARTPEDKAVWRKRYPGYEPVKIEFQYNDFSGWNVYLRFRKT